MLKKILLSGLAALITLALIFLRFYKLGLVPQGLNIDEASYGYEAYSILKSGNDSWGRAWPVTLKSFGDFKPAALSYAIIPAIRIFELTPLVVRLPSALAGALTIITLFYLLQTIRKNSWLNLSLVFVYALSPWAFGISRLFYEPNVGLFFFALGFLFSLKYLKLNNHKFFLYAAALIALSGIWYVALRITGLLYLGGLLLLKLYERKKFAHSLRRSTLYLFVFFLPIIILTFNHEGLTRLRQESVGQNYAYSLTIDENRSMCYLSSGKSQVIGELCALWWNKPVQRLEHIGKSLIYQISPNYLFFDQTQADILPKNTGPYVWLLAPLYLFGIYVLLEQIFRKKHSSVFALPIVLALLAGNLPAAVAGSPQLHRNVIGLFMAFIVIALGASFIIDNFKSRLLRVLIVLFFLFGILFQTSQFLVYYFAVYTKFNHELWRYDSKEIFSYAAENAPQYDEVWFESFQDAPLYYAFYTKFDPRVFQETVSRPEPNSGGWVHSRSLGKLKTVSGELMSLVCKYSSLPSKPRVLLITQDRGNFRLASIYQTRDFTDVHTIHEAYDLGGLTNSLLNSGWDPDKSCVPE